MVRRAYKPLICTHPDFVLLVYFIEFRLILISLMFYEPDSSFTGRWVLPVMCDLELVKRLPRDILQKDKIRHLSMLELNLQQNQNREEQGNSIGRGSPSAYRGSKEAKTLGQTARPGMPIPRRERAGVGGSTRTCARHRFRPE